MSGDFSNEFFSNIRYYQISIDTDLIGAWRLALGANIHAQLTIQGCQALNVNNLEKTTDEI